MTYISVKVLLLLYPTYLQNAEGKTQMEVNIERRHTDNVIFSFDRSRHTADRQTSCKLVISDYIILSLKDH